MDINTAITELDKYLHNVETSEVFINAWVKELKNDLGYNWFFIKGYWLQYVC